MDKTPSQEMLAHAEKLCAQRGVRLTPQRLEVLRLMSLQQGAISAYDLLDLLREKEPQAKPPTVYRALEFLLEQGFVHKVESTNSYVLCHLFDQPTHSSAMFICDRCGVVKEEAAEGVEDIMHGVCPAPQCDRSSRALRGLRGSRSLQHPGTLPARSYYSAQKESPLSGCRSGKKG